MTINKTQVKIPPVGRNDTALVISTLGEILMSIYKVTCGTFIVMLKIKVALLISTK